MSEQTRRIDLRFGDFAISAQGFDNPVQPVKQILRFVQRLVEETPEIAGVGFTLDDDQMDALMAELVQRTHLSADQLDVTPGLIVIARPDGGAEAAQERGDEAATIASAAVAAAPALAVPVGAEPVADPDSFDLAAEDPFAVPSGPEPEPEPVGVDEATGDHGVAEHAPEDADLGDDPGEVWAEEGTGEDRAGPVAADWTDWPTGDPEVGGSYGADADAADLAAGDVIGDELATDDLAADDLAADDLAGDDLDPDASFGGAADGHASTDPGAVLPRPLAFLRQADAGAGVDSLAPPDSHDEPEEMPDDDWQEIEAADPEPAPAPAEVNIFGSAADPEPAPAPAEVNIFGGAADPDPEPAPAPAEVNIFGGAADPEPAPAPVPAEVNIFGGAADPEPAPAPVPAEVNIFGGAADPEPAPAPVPVPVPVPAEVNIFGGAASSTPPAPRWLEDPNEPAPPLTLRHPEPPEAGSGGSSRFEALLSRYRGDAGASPVDETMIGPAGGFAAPSAGSRAPRLDPADLAERANATSVPELLAVAAAWLTLVDQRSRFGRREVMEIFDQLPGDHPRSLEARIKGYGKLVRNGSLVLVDDGLFALGPEERERFRDLIG